MFDLGHLNVNKIHEFTNPNTSPERLDDLATDENWYVRYWVARNPNTPHYVKKYLERQNYLEQSNA